MGLADGVSTKTFSHWKLFLGGPAGRDAVDGVRPLCMLLVVSFVRVERYLHVHT
jgi:hypothetical protein